MITLQGSAKSLIAICLNAYKIRGKPLHVYLDISTKIFQSEFDAFSVPVLKNKYFFPY